MKTFPTDLYLVLDPSVLGSLPIEEACRAAMEGGVRLIQYRDKRGERKRAYDTACRLMEIIHKRDGFLIINDDVDLTMAVETDGVHLGQNDLPVRLARSLLGSDRMIGASVHTLAQAVEAQKEGADYLGIGPIYASTTKQARPSLGSDFLHTFRPQVRIPIFAIGGVSYDHIPELMAARADGLAVVSAVLSTSSSAASIREASERLIQMIRRSKGNIPERLS